ncbi:MAG: RnfABCDGE type electron transport complex subunit D [Clostridiales bacterium]|jgi:electron transport complex protein RnfD|nr:RnfABCDGE type electron transport complex subunit D [Clostridiales bacterium]
MEEKLITVTSTPHIRSKDTIEKIMLDVIIALMPACIAGAYFFGIKAISILLLSVASCVGFELLFQKAVKKPQTVTDLSAVVTGLLLAMNLPVSSPLWMPIVGAFVAIILVKQLFGGLGQNFINPALLARAFLLTSYLPEMTEWTVDGVATVTPLENLKNGVLPVTQDYINALLGTNLGGCIGEVSAVALLLGGIYLILKRVISWRIPVMYLLTVFLLSFVLRRGSGIAPVPFYELITGGLLLGAIFMATDYSTSPITPNGKIIMGIGCGILTVLIRFYGGYPEGVSFAILLMNLAVPLIDRFCKPRVYGVSKKKKQALRGGE